jgi:hypothetical protein
LLKIIILISNSPKFPEWILVMKYILKRNIERSDCLSCWILLLWLTCCQIYVFTDVELVPTDIGWSPWRHFVLVTFNQFGCEGWLLLSLNAQMFFSTVVSLTGGSGLSWILWVALVAVSVMSTPHQISYQYFQAVLVVSQVDPMHVGTPCFGSWVRAVWWRGCNEIYGSLIVMGVYRTNEQPSASQSSSTSTKWKLVVVSSPAITVSNADNIFQLFYPTYLLNEAMCSYRRKGNPVHEL